MTENDNNKVFWYNAFHHLCTGLSIFQTKNPKDPGNAFFKKCIDDHEFLEKNDWINKFEIVFKIRSVDPIHIFSSINSKNLDKLKRIDRINILLRLLDSSYRIKDVDFNGCPTPVVVRMIEPRQLSVQNKIWVAFKTFHSAGHSALNNTIFKDVKQWNGVDIPSFTIFLFWINPRYYLPLDKNTISILLKNKIINDTPSSADEYKKILFRSDTILYINFAKVSYDSKNMDDLSEADKFDLWTFYRIKSTTRMSSSRDRVSELNINDKPREKDLINQINKINETEKVVKADEIDVIDFKIIAIKPLSGLPLEISKTLKINQIYSFYKSYDFKADEIVYNPSYDTKIYDLIERDLKISISAIVGKNGTGKSTLLELLFMAINNLSFKKRHIKKKGKFQPVKSLYVELYVKTTVLYKFVFRGENIEIYEYRQRQTTFTDPSLVLVDNFPLEQFFYSIAINYSIHALNSNYMGDWLHELFHKNDAYQTPIVIEPFRTKGNVDINKQDKLVKERLVSNLLEKEEDEIKGFSNLTEHYKAEKLRLKLNDEKINSKIENEERNIDIDVDDVDNAEIVLNLLLEKFGCSKFIDRNANIGKLESLALKYIKRKLVSIACTYEHYFDFFQPKNLIFINPNTYVNNLHNDKGHITYKLRRAINYLKYDLFRTEDYEVPIEELQDEISKIRSEAKNPDSIETVEFVPPSFFDVDVILHDKSGDNKILMNALSSGEKQKIYAVSSILYHIRNVDSVARGTSKITSYRYLNIILDEVELYFHPELQRNYIDHVLESLRKIYLFNILSIHICFVTHSPFIISDIPNPNILFLEKVGDFSVPRSINTKTFGANIHKLLMDGFFMEQTLGAFALKQISKVISFYEKVTQAKDEDLSVLQEAYSLVKNDFYFLMENLGEDYINGILRNHINYIEKRLNSTTYLEKEIELLNQQLIKLKSK